MTASLCVIEHHASSQKNEPGFSTADAEYPEIRQEDGDLSLCFKDWQERLIAVFFSDVYAMTSQLQQAIHLAQSLSFAEQLELLKTLATIIQQIHSLETQPLSEEDNTNFSTESFRKSWQEAVARETLPLSQFWEGIDVD